MKPDAAEVAHRSQQWDLMMGEVPQPHDPPRCIDCGAVHGGWSRRCWVCRTQHELEQRGLFGRVR